MGKRYGGRAKGTPNKKTMALEEFLERNDFNPLQKILDAFPLLDPEQQVTAGLKLMKFIYPEKRAVDHTFTPEAIEALETFDKFKDKSEEEILAELKLKRID